MTVLNTPAERIGEIKGLAIADAARATVLARAFRGRWVPARGGYAFTPFAYGRWQAMFAAGFTAVYRGGRWRFAKPGERALLDRYEAVRRAKGQLQTTP